MLVAILFVFVPSLGLILSNSIGLTNMMGLLFSFLIHIAYVYYDGVAYNYRSPTIRYNISQKVGQMKWFIILLLLIGTAKHRTNRGGRKETSGSGLCDRPQPYINHTLSIQVNDTITWINDGNSRLFLSGTKWNTSLAPWLRYTKTL